MATRRLLPTAPRPPVTDFYAFAWLLFGPPGIGKTTIASKFDRPFFLATEDGTKGIESYREDIGSWQDFTALLDALENEAHDFRTIVVDTVDLLYPLCLKSVCDDLGVDHPADSKWGKGWQTLGTRWTNGINRLRTLKTADGGRVCPVFISHESQRPITKTRGSKTIETGRFFVSSALSGKGRTTLHSSVDFILHFEMEEDGTRVIRTQPGSTGAFDIEAKGRGRDGAMLPELVPMDFRTLRRAFNRTLGAKPGNGGSQ